MLCCMLVWVICNTKLDDAQALPNAPSPYQPLSHGEGIGSYAKKVAEAGLGPLPDPRLVIPNHPEVCAVSWWLS